jgi:hypothetical protein
MGRWAGENNQKGDASRWLNSEFKKTEEKAPPQV